MILYKYMHYDAAVRLITTGSVSFSSYHNFNDPYELSCLAHGPGNINNMMEMRGQINLWGRNSVILCLTREHLNPLMWAHYADSHKGVVIGLDVSDDKFTSLVKNIIPVQFGSVIYTKTQPNAPYFTAEFPPTEIEQFKGFNTNYLEKLQRTFLYKSYHWAYEEEVRIVKHKHCTDLIEVPEHNICTMKLAENSIKEIHIGLRMDDWHNEFMALCNKYQPTAKLFKCMINGLSWDMYSASLDK
ncbi:DUF2971 domain-containing protein [Klebsiella pneumoniae]|uniref:DUF2971 domain-containing protein n=1 Tax=Klebsiella pneumoniae TaxID=573 RepID=UPI001DF872D0|nr:DUF2971 domain-containing protein [Klebsiella pneumoniae]MCB7581162.1 DUF2971 domain-containing protein [Klebsiella pneumoniae]